MLLQILQKQLDESTSCPLCQASMFWIEAEQYEQAIHFHECSHCQHRVFQDERHNCHCDRCLANRKRMLTETWLQEQRKIKSKDKEQIEYRLDQISFINKLFLLSILDNQVQEYTVHQ